MVFANHAIRSRQTACKKDSPPEMGLRCSCRCTSISRVHFRGSPTSVWVRGALLPFRRAQPSQWRPLTSSARHFTLLVTSLPGGTPSRDRRSPRLSQLLFCRDKVVAEFGLKVWRNLNVSIFQSSIYCHFAGKNIQWKSFMAKCKKKHHLSHGLIERVILSRK